MTLQHLFPKRWRLNSLPWGSESFVVFLLHSLLFLHTIPHFIHDKMLFPLLEYSPHPCPSTANFTSWKALIHLLRFSSGHTYYEKPSQPSQTQLLLGLRSFLTGSYAHQSTYLPAWSFFLMSSLSTIRNRDSALMLWPCSSLYPQHLTQFLTKRRQSEIGHGLLHTQPWVSHVLSLGSLLPSLWNCDNNTYLERWLIYKY